MNFCKSPGRPFGAGLCGRSGTGGVAAGVPAGCFAFCWSLKSAPTVVMFRLNCGQNSPSLGQESPRMPLFASPLDRRELRIGSLPSLAGKVRSGVVKQVGNAVRITRRDHRSDWLKWRENRLRRVQRFQPRLRVGFRERSVFFKTHGLSVTLRLLLPFQRIELPLGIAASRVNRGYYTLEKTLDGVTGSRKSASDRIAGR